MPLLISLLLGVALLILTLGGLLSDTRAPAMHRLYSVTSDSSKPQSSSTLGKIPSLKGGCKSCSLRICGWAGAKIRCLPFKTRKDLILASGTKLTETEFLGLQAVSATALTLLTVSRGLLALLLFSPITLIVGFYIPLLWLKRKGNSRRQQIAKELPEFMDHLALLLSAGQSLNSALSRSAMIGTGVLYQELKLAIDQIELGGARNEVLRELGLRSSSPELQKVCHALSRAGRFGGPIASNVTEMAADLRASRFQKAREAASRAPVKLLFPLVFLILPSFILLTVGGFILTFIGKW